VYAGVVFDKPVAISEMRITVFSPAGRAHLRDMRVMAADQESGGTPTWHILSARLAGAAAFADKVTVPPFPDGTNISIEIDPDDSHRGMHRYWGIGCLSASNGDARNYVPVGRGVYIRELQMK
jgi:hypothetical protein